MTDAAEDIQRRRLRDAGLRVTRPRLAVLTLLSPLSLLDDDPARGRHLPVSDIVRRCRQLLPDVSTQTVYDCLDALTRAGLLRRIETAGSPARYESRVGDNHHHLVCRGCGETRDVDCLLGQAPCLEPSDDHGFVVDEAEVVFWGLCPACAGGTASPTTPTTAIMPTTGPSRERAQR